MNEITNLLAEIKVSYNPQIKVFNQLMIDTSLKAFDIFKDLHDEATIAMQEEFIILYLNRNNKPIGTYKASKGGVAGTYVDIKIIMATALKCLASSMIICHNHPSGSLHPSEQDKLVTEKLNKACKMFDITLVDHLIITPQNEYYSFADGGLMTK